MTDSAATPPIEALLRQRAWLQRLAASIVVDEARADDLVQRAFLAALERPPAHASHPRAWLATVVRRLLRADEVRSARQNEHERIAAAPELQEPVDAVVAETALQHEMSAAVLALAEPYRTAILLRFSSNLAPRAIAKRTGAPVETVRTRLKRGLELLRAELVRRRGAGRPEVPREWAVALVGLLDSGMRRAVRRALLAKASGAGAAVAGATTFAGVLGVLGMSTQLKLAAAVVVVAGGTFAVVELSGSPKLPPREPVARTARGAPELAAPASVDAKSLPTPVEATRAADSHATPSETHEEAAVLSGVVEGIVLTARGEPAVGATVLIEDAARHGDFGTLDDLCSKAGELLAEPVKPHDLRQRTSSEKDGAFRFDGLVRGDAVNVAAVDGDEGTALQPGVVVSRDGTATRVELRLVEGVVLHGTVSDEQGVPVAKAEVGVNRFARVGNGTTSSSLLRLKTGDDGRYRTIPLPFRGFQVGASAEGFLGSSEIPIEILESEHDRSVDLRLERTVTLRGRLLGPDGGPAGLAHANGELRICWSNGDPRERTTSIEALAGQRGRLDREADRYEVTPNMRGARFISAWGGDVLLGAGEIVAPGVGPDVVVDLAKLPAATPTATLTLEVVRADDGAAAPRFQAEIRSDPTSSLDPSGTLETHRGDGSDGRLEFPDLRVGRYDVSIRAKGLVPRFLVASVTVPPTVTRVELQPATGFVVGRVEDENSRPVSGAKLYLLGPDGRVASPFPECSCSSDAEGGFVFKAVAEGSCSVVAEADGFAPASGAAVAVAKGDASHTDVVLTLRRGVSIEVEPRGRGVEVGGPFMVRIRDERGVPVVDHHRCPGFITSVFGRAMSFRLAPGSYTVELFCPKFTPGQAAFTATEGKVVEVELAPLAEPVGGR